MMPRTSNTIGIKPEVLNDLASRFLINLSEDDRSDSFKLLSQIEQAHWFYLDLLRPENPSLPACSLKEFMANIFEHCPFLVNETMNQSLDALITQWKSHKYKKPVRGAIILNKDLTKCLLVQGYPASTSWGFPKGKLEEGEDDVDTAVREVYEETSFDSREIIQRDLHLDATINDSHSRMYIIPGVPESTVFEPKTRKEIRASQWFCVDDLPRYKKDMSSKLALGKSANTFFLVIPFISQLRKWIASQRDKKRNSKKRAVSATFNTATPPMNQTLNKPKLIPTVSREPLSTSGSVTHHPQTTPHQSYHGNSVTRIPVPLKNPQTYSTPPHIQPPQPYPSPIQPPQPYPYPIQPLQPYPSPIQPLQLYPSPIQPLQPYPSPIQPLQPNPATPLRPPQTHPNILQALSMRPPQTYPAPPLRLHPTILQNTPLHAPRTQDPSTLPAPLQSTPIGRHHQGMQYTAVYPAHIAYSNKHMRTGPNHSTGRNMYSGPFQSTDVSSQPYHISTGQEHFEGHFRTAQNKTENGLLQYQTLFGRPPASREKVPEFKPSLYLTGFRFDRERVLAASKFLYP